MISLNGLLVLNLFYIIATAYDYEIVLRDENIFQHCDEFPNDYLDKFLDISNLHFQGLDNESVHIYGPAEIIQNVKLDTLIQTSIQIYKKDRDKWVNTIYNLYRPDTCHAAFDTTEIWHKFIENLPMEQKICPFYTGQTFTFDAASDLTIDLPDARVAGEYRARIIVKFEDEDTNDVLCTDVYASVYRK